MLESIEPLEKAMKKVAPTLTKLQEQQLEEVENYVQSLFHEKAEQWARSTGFVQRSSKITGSAFAQTLVFGLSLPAGGLLHGFATDDGVKASPCKSASH